jgi:hypothetical protein
VAIDRFFEDEACALAQVITATGHRGYPVTQQERDLLFATRREARALEEVSAKRADR